MTLSIDDKKQIILDRVAKLENDAYHLELNRKFAASRGNEEAEKQYAENVEALEASVAFHHEELAALGE